jgi:hypothetical protein
MEAKLRELDAKGDRKTAGILTPEPKAKKAKFAEIRGAPF